MSMLRDMMTVDGFREDVRAFDMYGDLSDEQYEYLDSLSDEDIDNALDKVDPEFSDSAMNMIAEESTEANKDVMDYLLNNRGADRK